MDKVLHSSVDMTWTTPQWFLDLVVQFNYGAVIGYDPASQKHNPTRAKAFSFVEQSGEMTSVNGLSESGHGGGLHTHWWSRGWGKWGLIFCNPPYGRALGGDIDVEKNKGWARKMATEDVDEAIYLVPSRTDTVWWHELYEACDATLLIKGRLKFGNQKNSAPFPSCVFYRGTRADRFGEIFGHIGAII